MAGIQSRIQIFLLITSRQKEELGLWAYVLFFGLRSCCWDRAIGKEKEHSTSQLFCPAFKLGYTLARVLAGAENPTLLLHHSILLSKGCKLKSEMKHRLLIVLQMGIRIQTAIPTSVHLPKGFPVLFSQL